MNIESTSANITKTTNNSTSSSTVPSRENSSTFKDELETVKAQETKTNEDAQNIQTEKAETENIAQKEAKDKLTMEQDKTIKASIAIENEKISNQKLSESKMSDPLSELTSKIATINNLKNGSNFKTQSIDSKTMDKVDHDKTIKMDNKDITFFLNLVDNQQLTAQSSQLNNQLSNSNLVNNAFTEIKTNATQSTVQISQTLLDALNDSAKTGKPFRIDFSDDIAVIMKVDKEGVLSANFIPGSAAVEAYLKNNIAGLKQSFDNQGLRYNELSYSNQQKEKQQKQKKENEHE